MTQAISRSNPQTQSDTSLTIDTLIITVGTRQIGWRCNDGIVRCFGVDGDRNAPAHTNELYEQIGIERGTYQYFNFLEQKQEYLPWRMRDLGQRYYEYAEENNDFGQVELLMDEAIICHYANRGMKQLILWATNQPEKTSIFYRRDDTLWLTKLMAQKVELLKQQNQWELDIQVVAPEVNARDYGGIYKFLTTEILPPIVERADEYSADEEFILAIENTGSVPAISESLAIFAAGLIRQFTVVNLTPTLPNPLYEGQDNTKNAVKSSEHRIISVGDYFWSVEKPKIMSAWKRGDFNEARIWLTPHQHKYDGLIYDLAEKLTLCSNGEFYPFVRYKEKGIESWIEAAENSSLDRQNLSLSLWKRLLKQALRKDAALVYESSFSIYLLLKRENYTNAFRLFTQTIERLLYAECKQKDWIRKGIVKTEKNYAPRFVDLIEGWLKSKSFDRQQKEKLDRVLNDIRHVRNKIVHEAKPLQPEEILKVWASSQLEEFKQLKSQENLSSIYEGMKIIMSWIYQPREETLFQSLYEWGLETLEAD